MKKLILVLALSVASLGQVPVAPITQPHVTFVNAAGSPCSACTLGTFVAGTTTPLATYVDSGGVSQNTNPIVLDAAGGANIWLGNNSYKFILKTPAGTTIWTVDNVKGGGGIGGICGPAGSIQIANVGINGLTCDASITINTTNHTLNVGTLPANHVTIGALSTPTSWTFDTTSPATALASIGGGSVTSVALTTPSWLTVAGSPITTSGTLAVTATPALAANQFIATPDGATGAVALRSIAPADLPVATTGAFGAVKPDGTTITVTAGVISAASGTAETCNANGCYFTLPNGNIIQRGTIPSCASSGHVCTATVTFPTAFTTTSNLTVTCSIQFPPGNGTCTVGNPSTTSVGINQAALVFNGGSGGGLDGSQTVNWVAIGK